LFQSNTMSCRAARHKYSDQDVSIAKSIRESEVHQPRALPTVWEAPLERHFLPVEQLDQLGEVGQGTGQSVDFVDHHDVDIAGLDLRNQGFQGQPFK
jgi:hypothetical protein